MLIQLAVTAAETAETHVELPVPAWVIAVGMMAAFLVMMFATMSFSSVGKRHSVVEEHADPHRQHPNKHDHSETTH
jgi:cytochrome c-type biogenesis protein CcmH/NrfG